MNLTPAQLAEWVRLAQARQFDAFTLHHTVLLELLAELARLQAIADAAEHLVAHQGNVREDEMWERLHTALRPRPRARPTQVTPLFLSYEEWQQATSAGKTAWDYNCSICGASPVGFTSDVWLAGVCYPCWHEHKVWELLASPDDVACEEGVRGEGDHTDR